MKLVETTEWLNSILDTPPLYDYERIIPEPDIELRLIGVRHHTDGGVPDYIDSILSETDVFAPELPGWSAESERLLTKMTRGDYAACRKIIDGAALAERDPGALEYNQYLMKAAYMAKKPIILIDYPQGTKFDRMNNALRSRNIADNWPLHKAREQHILEVLGSAVKSVREDARRSLPSPLRLTMVYGAFHMGLTDGATVAAEEHGVDISIRRDFEESIATVNSAPDMQYTFLILSIIKLSLEPIQIFKTYIDG